VAPAPPLARAVPPSGASSRVGRFLPSGVTGPDLGKIEAEASIPLAP
jgi:hypothetical protein